MIAFHTYMLAVAVGAYQARDYFGAESVLRLLLGRSGDDAYVLYFIGHLAYVQGRLVDARLFLAASLTMAPDHARAHNDLGETLRALGRAEDALPHLERAIGLEPSLAHAYGNLATVLVTLDRPEDALRWAQESLRRATDKVLAHIDLGSVFGRLNRPQEAIRQYDLALALQPGHPRARYFRGLMLLTLGRMPEGWEEHEARLDLGDVQMGARRFAQPLWTGAEDLTGRTILLHGEQGFGDTIQFVRYVAAVRALGATVLLEVQRGLGRLCAGITEQVFEQGDGLPAFDVHCGLMSLPAVFHTGMRSIPCVVPYLVADPALCEMWRARLGPWTKMRVGLAWSGSPGHAADRNRSIPAELLRPLLSHDEIEWHVVQRDVREHNLPGLRDQSAGLTDFAETAALLRQMDMVITVDTAIAHLAGALNMNTWLLLAHSADWRWMRDRDDSPWYPSMRLFRQKNRGDWGPVLDAVSHNLDEWAIRRG